METLTAAVHADGIRDVHAARRADSVACRVLDVLAAALLLVVLAPVLALISLAIRLDSPGRAIFRQQRVGHGLRRFTVNKFRTMRADAGEESHQAYVVHQIATGGGEDGAERPFFKMATDKRVTRVGRILRKSSLDELPQLWNVLAGDMSLVGPRPAIPYEVEHYPEHWHARFAVKPGMTGLWQVSGRSQLTIEQMIELDIEYARSRSLWLNLKILVRTIPAVLLARGAA